MNLLGRILYLSCFFLFLLIFFTSSYTLTPEILKKTVREEHYMLLDSSLSGCYHKEYDLSCGFVNVVNAAIEKTNDQLKKEQRWDQVIYDDYAVALTRSSAKGWVQSNPTFWCCIIFLLGALGGLLFIYSKSKMEGLPGIKHHGIFTNPFNSRGWSAILFGVFLIFFYILLYFYPAYLLNWIQLVDPVQKLLNPNATASQWFLYGFLYTYLVIILGIRMLMKYRHNRYQQIRTVSVMFFQTCLAFIIPELLVLLNQPYFDFKNIWPLDYDFFDAWHINMLTGAGGVGIFMLVWGITLVVAGVPLFVYFFGKRWYCSWVCGCGGLAETVGDPFRQLSNKSLSVWRFERILIYSVLIFSIVMTAGVIYTFMTGQSTVLGLDTYTHLRKPYGFLIGAIFSGVIGTGFYPFLGNRVWCRFGCPLAAYMGLIQRFKSRFRITTNGGHCISCGNCSTYCEMGIDVRWYAQRGQNIVRASCVGCGICSAVCPRGVLNLENLKEPQNKIYEPLHFKKND